MRLRWPIFALLLLSAASSFGGEVIDRIVATVNGHIILQSDWEDELQYECFMSGRDLQSLTPADRKSGLERLIDQELVSEQLKGTEIKLASVEEVEKHLQGVKADFSHNNGNQSWIAALTAHGLSESDVRERIALELNQLHLVDVRLRPTIQIDPAAVEVYYKEQFLPELARANAHQVTLKEAAPKIREILTQQKINQMLSSWLESLRVQAQVQWLISDSSDSQGHAQ